ncbi:cell division protein FtsB [Xenorhabdus vietnamensis]|uniref:Cell division protein FtsB n=1 Tax=Xenorhabdus vietnamensis TaxID=351656 RepID=A0A1Y2SHE9_9GAMM|nr:cell division protein FtsB [Xenorhabdus vietnamensis]OTA17013.1 cell division protein FtsB [Xenorhabdus vietnamensis]
MGKLTLLLLVLLGWLQYALWFGKNGIHDYMQLKAEVSKQETNYSKLKARNNRLFTEVEDLKNLEGNLEAIEERARDELGMIKPGESFYRMMLEVSKSNTSKNNEQ